MSEDMDDDTRAINDLVARQFASMSWQQGGAPDWTTFAGDFLPGATLYPSARPLQARSIDQFVERMSGLIGTSLRSFEETVLGTRIMVFGHVAVAAVACENRENATDTNRNVEMMLLVKDAGGWKIACQAWDKATDANPIPRDLLAQA